jgi:glycosyltransferase involved in cell wall biosynthesis
MLGTTAFGWNESAQALESCWGRLGYALMPKTLYITTELPYFPGQGGLMSLAVRHLATCGFVGVVGPSYPNQPREPLEMLRRSVHRTYWWPELPMSGDIPSFPTPMPPFATLVKRLPVSLKQRLLRRLAGVHHFSDEAIAWRAVLVNLAPKILEALQEQRWNSVLLTRSSSIAWLPFLPASVARCIYLHDIRSDYLVRTPDRTPRRLLRLVRSEERAAMTQSDSVVFVSELDEERAARLLPRPHSSAVAPICVDLEYFAFRPCPQLESEPVVLFTGHLGHPPNVDAVSYFLSAIWPLIKAARPDARFRIVGLQPVPEVVAAATRTPGAELIPNAVDIRTHFRNSRVFVVPMRFGGGVRQKILEAWASGLPVVTTTMGAEGIGAKDGENCWVRDEPVAFSNQVIALLSSSAPSCLLHQARVLVEKEHSPEISCPKLEAQLSVAIGRRRKSCARVLFDLRWLLPGVVGGVEQMTRELIDELAAFDRTHEYRLLGPAHVCRWRRFEHGFKHRIIAIDDLKARWQAFRDSTVQQLTTELSIPPILSPEVRALEFYNRLDFSVVHGLPCFVHPDLRRFPSVVTMHDLQHLHFPGFFTPQDISTREREYRESCRLADHVICISEFTRQDVHRRYGVPLEKMTTVWNLPPRITARPQAPSTVWRTLRQLGISPPFLFYPAQPWPHKNHRGLLEALRLAFPSLPAGLRLVLTGRPWPADHPANDLLDEPALRGKVIHLGYRTSHEVAALYHAAEALVMPSLFEGFGIPVIEAMQQGCPVICGAHTALPEIAGDAALFADVSRADLLASSIVELVSDSSLRARLRQAGHNNVMRFDRRALAQKTRDIYTAVHERHFS